MKHDDPRNDPMTDALAVLAEAGITYTVVDRCPTSGCLVCDPVDLGRAA